LGILAFSGCGFAPIYGEGGALRDTLAYQTDESVAGFRMRGRLEERLGMTSAPLFVLSVTQSAESRTSAITADGDTTRFNVIGTAKWALTDAASGAEVAAGEVQTFTGYAATGSTAATQAAATDAARRLSVALADMIVSRILILSPELAP
jgi:LPS-assembly lipoprotein